MKVVIVPKPATRGDCHTPLAILIRMFDAWTQINKTMRSPLSLETALLTTDQLKTSMTVVLSAERFLAGYKARIAARSDELNEQGSGDPTDDVMRSGGQVSKKEATKQAARTNVAKKLPSVGKSLHKGKARPENIDALARTLDDLTDDELEKMRASDEDLATRSEAMPPENFRRYLHRKLARIRKDAGQTEFDQQRSNSRVHLSRQLETGMHTLYAQLDPERGAALEQAIKSKTRSIARREGGKDSPIEVTANVRAQALYELIMDGTQVHDSKLRSTSTSVSRIPSITLITDVRTFLFGPHERSVSETWAGTPLPPKSLARNACDACVHEVVIGLDGEPINVGRDYRTVTDGQRKALRSRYSGCPISGTSFIDCEIHHVKFWEDGGPTDLANLVPISRRWHHLVHDGGWSLRITSDRTLVLHRPDGSFYREVPPPDPLVKPEGGHSQRTGANNSRRRQDTARSSTNKTASRRRTNSTPTAKPTPRSGRPGEPNTSSRRTRPSRTKAGVNNAMQPHTARANASRQDSARQESARTNAARPDTDRPATGEIDIQQAKAGRLVSDESPLRPTKAGPADSSQTNASPGKPRPIKTDPPDTGQANTSQAGSRPAKTNPPKTGRANTNRANSSPANLTDQRSEPPPSRRRSSIPHAPDTPGTSTKTKTSQRDPSQSPLSTPKSTNSKNSPGSKPDTSRNQSTRRLKR